MSIRPITNVFCAIDLQNTAEVKDLEWSANFEGQAAMNMPQKITIKNAVLSIVVPKDSNFYVLPQIHALILSGISNTTDFSVHSTENGPTTTYKNSTANSALILVLNNVQEIYTIETTYLHFDYRMIGELDVSISTSTIKGVFYAWNYNRVQNNPEENPFDLLVWSSVGTISTPSWKRIKANSFQITNKTMGNNIIFSLIIERTN